MSADTGQGVLQRRDGRGDHQRAGQDQALQVASRTSAFAFKGKNQDIGEIGEQLNVATVLEGSVRKAGNRLRITAQLINVDRRLSPLVGAVRPRAGRRLRGAGRDRAEHREGAAGGADEARRSAPSSGRRPGTSRPTSSTSAAGSSSTSSARRDSSSPAGCSPGPSRSTPSYARAYAGIADCSSQLYKYWDASAANLEQAESASRKALELAPELAEAHAARGFALTLGGNQ